MILCKQTHFRNENIVVTLVKEEGKDNKYDVFLLLMHLESIANRGENISCLQHKVKCREIV